MRDAQRRLGGGPAAPWRRVLPACLWLAGCLSSASVSAPGLGRSVVLAAAANHPSGAATLAVTVQLADDLGIPLVGVSVDLEAGGCEIDQPSWATDARGQTTGTLRCPVPGQVVITGWAHLGGNRYRLPAPAQVTVYPPGDGQAGVAMGTPLSAQSAVVDAAGVVDTAWTGTVVVRCTDPNALLPAPVTVGPDDHGVAVFARAVLFRSPGAHQITTVAYPADTALQTQAVLVGVQGATVLEGAWQPGPVAAGEPAHLAVTARGADGASVPAYTGQLRTSSTDPDARLPDLAAFAGAGVLDLSVVFNTLGPQGVTLRGVDAYLPVVQPPAVTVVPGPPVALELALAATSRAGVAIDVHVSARDRLGNLAPVPAGLEFFSSDLKATLPAATSATDGPADEVVYPAGLVLRTPGTQSVWVGGAATLAPARQEVQVATVATVAFGLAAAATATAGVPLALQIEALGADGGRAIDYSGTVALASTDPEATYGLPLNISVANQGVVTMPQAAVLRTAGEQNLTVRDLLQPQISGTTTLAVEAAAAVQLRLVVPGSVVGQVPFSLGALAVDAFGNRQPTWTGQVALTSDDPYDTLPGPLSLTAVDGGQGTFSQPLRMGLAGARTLTASDANGQLIADVHAVTVTPGAPVNNYENLYVSGPAGWMEVNSPANLVIDFYDAFLNCNPTSPFLNRCSTYRGTTYLCTGGCNASGPPSASLQDGDNGELSFAIQAHAPGRVLMTLFDPAVRLGSPQAFAIGYAASNLYGNQDSGGGVSQSPANSAFAPSLALGASGLPTLAWNDQRNGSQVYLMRWDGVAGAWAALAGSQAGGGVSHLPGTNDQVSLALDPATGDPVVAWRHVEPQASDSAIYLAAWSAGAWQARGGSLTAGGITGEVGTTQDQPRLAFRGGRPLVAFHRNAGGSDEVQVWAFDGSAWAGLAGSGDIFAGPQDDRAPAVAVDASDVVYVAWQSTLSGRPQILLRTFAAGAWAGMGGSDAGAGISQTAGVAQAPALALDGNGAPWVAWRDNTFATQLTGADTGRILVGRWDGSAWSSAAGSALATGISAGLEDCQLPSIAWNAAEPGMVVAWSRAHQGGPVTVHLRQWTGASWDEVEASDTAWGVPAGLWGNSQFFAPQLAVASGGQAVIAWPNRVAGNQSQVHLLAWP